MDVMCKEHIGCLDKNSVSESDSFGGLLHNTATPFVHRFKTDNENYIYDINTLRILKVSPVVWDVIEDFGLLSEEQMLATYSPPYRPEEIASALHKIEHTRNHDGLLLSKRPQTILPPREEMIHAKLNAHREQLILNVTEHCNFRCTYCLFGESFEGYRDHSEQVMSWEVAQKAIQDFFQHAGETKIRSVGFYGGEPLLNMKLIRQCVDYIQRTYNNTPVQFSLTTNGSMLHGETARFLADENFILIVSLDGPREIHDSCRRTKNGDPTWDSIIANLRDFLKSYPKYQSNNRLKFHAVATQSMNLCDCQSFWSRSELVSGGMGLTVSSQKEGWDKENLLSQNTPLSHSLKTVYKEFIQNLINGDYIKEYGNSSMWTQAALFEQPYMMFHKRGRLSPHLPDTMRFLNHCIPGARRTFVSVCGEYYSCERVPTCKAQCIGNIHTGVDREKVMSLIHRWVMASNEQCQYCWCLPTCGVGCLATLGDEDGFSREAKEKACAFHRQNMHRVIEDYCRILEQNPKAFDYANEIEFF